MYFPHDELLLHEHEIVDMSSRHEYLLLTGDVEGHTASPQVST